MLLIQEYLFNQLAGTGATTSVATKDLNENAEKGMLLIDLTFR